MSDDSELDAIRMQKMRDMMQSKKEIPNEVVEISSVDHFNQLVGPGIVISILNRLTLIKCLEKTVTLKTILAYRF